MDRVHVGILLAKLVQLAGDEFAQTTMSGFETTHPQKSSPNSTWIIPTWTRIRVSMKRDELKERIVLWPKELFVSV